VRRGKKERKRSLNETIVVEVPRDGFDNDNRVRVTHPLAIDNELVLLGARRDVQSDLVVRRVGRDLGHRNVLGPVVERSSDLDDRAPVSPRECH